MAWRRGGRTQGPKGVRHAVADSLQPAVSNRGAPPGASPCVTRWTAPGAMASVRSPPSIASSHWLSGSSAVPPLGRAGQARDGLRLAERAVLDGPEHGIECIEWSRREVQVVPAGWRQGLPWLRCLHQPLAPRLGVHLAPPRRAPAPPTLSQAREDTHEKVHRPACAMAQGAGGLQNVSIAAGAVDLTPGATAGGPCARRVPSPHQPRYLQPVWGQKCREVSTVRGRRWVSAMGAGGSGGGGGGGGVACSHSAQGGLSVRPTNG